MYTVADYYQSGKVNIFSSLETEDSRYETMSGNRFNS